MTEQLAQWGMELVERDHDGLMRVRYTSENPNRGFFRQFDTRTELESWIAAMTVAGGGIDRVEYAGKGIWEAI
jgi:hypothetical protein